MDVRCERCKTEYEFEDERITEAGVAVKCTQCGHVFKVKKQAMGGLTSSMSGVHEMTAEMASSAGAGARGEKPKEWRLRQSNGNQYTFRELTTLQRWIVERKVVRDDEITLNGENWKRLGDISHLGPFFDIVDEAQKAAQLAGMMGGIPIRPPGPSGPLPPLPGPGLSPEPDTGQMGRPIEFVSHGSLNPSYEPQGRAARKKRKGGTFVGLMVTILGMGTAAYFTSVFDPYLPEDFRSHVLIQEVLSLFRGGKPAPTATSTEKPASVEAKAPESALPAVAPDAGTVLASGPATVSDKKTLDEAAKSVPAGKSYDWYLTQAEQHRQKSQGEVALAYYEKASDMEPDRAEPYAGRGLALLDLGRRAQAEAAFSQALKRNAQSAVAIMGLAETYRAQGKKESALVFYRRYLELVPNGAESAVARAAIKRLQEQGSGNE